MQNNWVSEKNRYYVPRDNCGLTRSKLIFFNPLHTILEVDILLPRIDFLLYPRATNCDFEREHLIESLLEEF